MKSNSRGPNPSCHVLQRAVLPLPLAAWSNDPHRWARSLNWAGKLPGNISYNRRWALHRCQVCTRLPQVAAAAAFWISRGEVDIRPTTLQMPRYRGDGEWIPLFAWKSAPCPSLASRMQRGEVTWTQHKILQSMACSNATHSNFVKIDKPPVRFRYAQRMLTRSDRRDYRRERTHRERQRVPSRYLRLALWSTFAPSFETCIHD